MRAAENDPARQLVVRLERLLEERAELLDTLARLPGGETQAIQRTLHERLETLTREQERIVAELTAIIPPDEAHAGDPPN